MAEHPLREYARTKFEEYVKFPAVARNMERSLYNWSVKGLREMRNNNHNTMREPESMKNIEFRKSLSSSWECRMFRLRYKVKLTNLLAELKRGGVVERMRAGELNLRNIAEYGPEMLRPDGLYAKQMMAIKDREMKMEENKAKEENYEGLLKCGRCKSLKTTYYQMQTRSADEVSQYIVIVLNFILTPHPNSP